MSIHGKRKLNKPFRTPSASKKFGVYVRNRKTGRVQIVRFGQKGYDQSKIIQVGKDHFLLRFRPAISKSKRSGKHLSPATNFLGN